MRNNGLSGISDNVGPACGSSYRFLALGHGGNKHTLLIYQSCHIGELNVNAKYYDWLVISTWDKSIEEFLGSSSRILLYKHWINFNIRVRQVVLLAIIYCWGGWDTWLSGCSSPTFWE